MLRKKSGIALVAASVAAAALSWAPPSHAEGASLDAATAEQKATAKDKYLAGKAAYDQQKYEEALPLFQASYDTVASPNSHLMVARCLARLGRAFEAFEAFRATQTEAEQAAKTSDKYRVTATAAKNESAEVRAQLATVSVEIEARALVGDQEVGPLRSAEPAVVAPGPVTVRLETPNGVTEEQIEVSAGEDKVLALQPPAPAPVATSTEAPAAPPPPPSGIDQKVLAYVFGGVGVVGFATFGVFGMLNNQKYDDLKSSCDPNGICPASLSDTGETGRMYQTLANVGLGVGAVGLVTGLTLFLTAPSDPTSEASRGPRIAVGPGSVRVDGRF
jgi:hypothetical protein